MSGQVSYEDPVTQEGFAQLPIVVMTRRDLSHGAKLVYAYLGHVAWRTSGSHYTNTQPPREVIAEALAMSEKSVTNYIAELRKAPVLEGDETENAPCLVKVVRRGQGATNDYIIRLPKLPESADVGEPEKGKSRSEEKSPLGAQEVPFPLSSQELKKEETYVSNADLPDSSLPPLVYITDENQNEPLNALAEACGIKPRSPRLGQAAKALNGPKGKPEEGIRWLYWQMLTDWAVEHDDLARLDAMRQEPRRFSDKLAEAIRLRSRRQKSRMPGVTFSPATFRDWFVDLDESFDTPAPSPKAAGLKPVDLDDGFDTAAVGAAMDKLLAESEHGPVTPA